MVKQDYVVVDIFEASLRHGRSKPRRQLKRIAEPEEPSTEAPDDASDQDSDLQKPRPAVNIGHLSGLGASAEGVPCSTFASLL